MSDTIFCYAYVNAKIMPVARGKIFATPLEQIMEQKGIGKVSGGGTLQDKTGEIIHCGIDIELVPEDANIKFVRDFLTERGAPKGSKLQLTQNGDKREFPFGQIEGIGIYLNGTDLPPEVYASSDVNVVMETFAQRTKTICTMRGYWQGPRETALYMYGKSAAALESSISEFMGTYPLCQRARVVRIA
ncbi:MAG TPA: hypothetical protein VHQ47_11835 [Phycisphaerae bacterium]|nr:hypothetical protein [Phycisphaerae bacterium]